MALESLTDIQSILNNPKFLALFLVVTAWKFAWYGTALWKIIEKKRKVHFIVLFALMFVLNDLGILPILYLIWDKYKKQNEIDRPKKKA